MREDIESCIKEMLTLLGEDSTREGLVETPARVARAWEEMTSGYKQSAKELLSTKFTDGACDSMVILKDCAGWSTCEHHLLPFSYTVSIGYIPNGKVVGISKLARLAECFGRRLQIQERFTEQIADAIMNELKPLGVMVVMHGEHLCMKARGVKQQESSMVTSAIRGIFAQQEVRAEFMSLIK